MKAYILPLADPQAELDSVGGKGLSLAREYGIPAVMAARGATHNIQDGQIVTVDGTASTVTLTNLRPAGSSSAATI